MTEDEIAAVHEAAHAVFAAFSPWTRIHGPVSLSQYGVGDVVMATNVETIAASARADSSFDRDLPRLHLVRCLLAGPIAERVLNDRGQAPQSESVLRAIGEEDYAEARRQLDQLNPPGRDLLPRLESDVRAALERPEVWSTVEGFAAVLLERRSLDADEATAILRTIARETGLTGAPSYAARIASGHHRCRDERSRGLGGLRCPRHHELDRRRLARRLGRGRRVQLYEARIRTARGTAAERRPPLGLPRRPVPNAA